MEPIYAAIDIGGTRTKVGYGSSPEHTQISIVYDTPSQFATASQQIITNISNLSTGKELRGITVGIPGQADGSGVIKRTAHLPDWNSQPLGPQLQAAFSVPVIIQNDTALMALGEAKYGAGQGHQIVVYLSVGTGVGGARVVDGFIDANRLGFEPGHMRSNPQSPAFEYFIAGAGITARTGQYPSEVTDAEVWAESTSYLATLIYNCCLVWSPDLVVLGGGLIDRQLLKLEQINAALQSIDSIFPSLPKVVLGQLGDQAGLKGGISLHLQN